MHERILIAGAGGQGVLLIGKVLASAAVAHVPHMTYFPAYGAEVRGGTSNCQVILSSEEIASPVAETFDSLVILNQASEERFLDHAAEGALVIVNSSVCSVPACRNVVGIAANDHAAALGDLRAANVVMLGAYLARRPTIPAADIEAGIRQTLASKGSELVDLNVAALHTGMQDG